MRLTVFSYKPCWPSADGYATDGGFPLQMRALAGVVDGLRLVLPLRQGAPPAGTTALAGPGVEVVAVPEPAGSGFGRKLRLPFWLLANGPRLWREAGAAEAVHALIPGDLGTLGLLAALARGKRLFIRHCGTWGNRDTAAEAFLTWLLPRIAGGQRVIFATGGGAEPPRGGVASWIFSTTLGAAELATLPLATPWRPGESPRLVMVGRLTRGKNAAAAVAALPAIQRAHPGASLDLVGDGPCRPELESLVAELGLGQAVAFHGNLSHAGVLEVLGRSHLFVFPTRVAEGFPKAVIEAMACGLPVVAPPVSVLPHLLAEGGGRLLAATTAAGLGQAVLELLAAPELLPAMGLAARATAERHSLEQWAELIRARLEAVWESPLRSGQGALAR